jgi:acetylornithine deacetylase/succinyl-diaminopimelate desuccinylase-like protein
VRPASEVERRRLNDLFRELCAIPSPFGNERACADRVAAELRGLGLEVSEDDAGAAVGANAGNLLARMRGDPPGGRPQRDRGRGARDRGDGAGAARRGDDRERRNDPRRRRRDEHRG